MDIEEIYSILDKYNDLLEITYNTIHKLEKIHFAKYNTARGIENIEFNDIKNIIYVTCDDSFRECYDTMSFSFPMEWLTKSELELTELVTKELELDAEIKRVKKIQKEEEEKRRKEENDLAEYNRLKTKFEQ
jgi:hypothetical protein